MEEHGQTLIELMVVVIIAFLIPIVLERFKIRALPLVVAEIIAGLVLGKSGFNVIGEDPWLELLSLFGFIYLMFLSGLEIDFTGFGRKRARQGEPNPPVTAALIFIIILGVSYGLSLLLVEMALAEDPYLMTIIISTISLGVVVPVLKGRRMLNEPLGQILLLVTVIADFVSMILLSVYISVQSGSMTSMLLLVLFFVAVIAVYMLIKRFSIPALAGLLSHGTIQLAMRSTFALLLLLVVLSESLGVENILGAFLAGVTVSLLRPSKDFVRQLDSFGYGFLIPIFFIMVGINLEIWELFTDWKTVLLIPVLLLFIFISKIVPTLLLRRWFDWRTVLGSGALLSSTLSLVIAASTIALELGLITDSVYGALILVAIISCIIFPVLFNRYVPEPVQKQPAIGIVGANHMTLPIVPDLAANGYRVSLYSVNFPEQERGQDRGEGVRIVDVPSLDKQVLVNEGLFDHDILVFGTSDDEENIRLAEEARAVGKERIVLRVENPELYEMHHRQGYTVFSTLHASRTLLRALVEQPTMVRLFASESDTTREIVLSNNEFHQMLLRELPHLGGVLILRVFRNNSFLIPHGNTELLIGDRLLVSGTPEDLDKLSAAIR